MDSEKGEKEFLEVVYVGIFMDQIKRVEQDRKFPKSSKLLNILKTKKEDEEIFFSFLSKLGKRATESLSSM